MCKCSFVRVAWLAACLALASTQEYEVNQPTGDVVFNSVRSADVALIFDKSEIVVNPGEPLYLDCGARGDVRSCIWETEGGEIYQVQDVYENVYTGLTKPENTNGNECGIVVNSATMEHHGHWTCKVFVVGNSLVGKKNVIVTVKPTSPVLEIDDRRSLTVNGNSETPVQCSVAAARPAVTIRWFLGNRDVTVSAATEETPADRGGIYKSLSVLRRSFEPADNGKVLMCSISHKTLLAPENATVPLNVIFKPAEQPLTTFYQISPGSDYEVRFNFSANPPPIRQEWRFGESFDNPAKIVAIPSVDGRYTTGLEELGTGMYTAKLLITDFMEDDANMEYVLIVENDMGETPYKVRLSMNEAPAETLSGGAVAGIVIVLLIIIVALCAATYARYRQMFCFAPVTSPDPEEGKEDREEHSDTESARGTTPAHTATIKTRLGQLTQVFRKPKKDQETKLEDNEKKSLTKDEMTKGSPYNDRNPDEKEVVYAELDLGKGEADKKADVKADEKTEYAQIVGTLTDNREEEKKE
ncbi:hypothetical protein Pcinc_019299 [Petrolisthes cinctipes]|uniref:Ig-like domain-containing protein n=1 Tax=Petrolisthes cinctipes TaxID=88211 RepID=A0AAE1FLI0_PETCI|nr:hypothetical protein Pcinc_019299 [Petrolisthes cinctipes]